MGNFCSKFQFNIVKIEFLKIFKKSVTLTDIIWILENLHQIPNKMIQILMYWNLKMLKNRGSKVDSGTPLDAFVHFSLWAPLLILALIRRFITYISEVTFQYISNAKLSPSSQNNPYANLKRIFL